MTVVMLYATFPDQSTAESICGLLVEERLAACANILMPIKSIYRWQGRIENSNEIPAYLKTTIDALPALAARFKTLHPYETPCLIQVNGNFCWPDYAQWVRENT